MAETRGTGSKKTDKIQKVVIPAQALVSVGEAQAKGFIDFIRTQGVVGLAVGLVLGTAVSTVARSLVDNIIMPPVGLILGSGNGLKGLSWEIGRGAGNDPAVIQYGTFLNDIINFLILALSVYLIFHLLGLTKLDKKKE